MNTQGVRIYPSETGANQPPPPYYIRGLGTQLVSRNLGNSERFGSRWKVSASGYTAVGENATSYGKHLVDSDEQATHMAVIGWKKITSAYQEKENKVRRIYEKWIKRALESVGFDVT